MNNSRRDFIRKTAFAGAAMVAAPSVFGSEAARKRQKATDAITPFKLKYAPSFGMFKEHAGTDLVDNIKFCNDMGFRAMFDNDIMKRPVDDQMKIVNEMNRLGMDLGPFVLYADFSVTSFVLNKPEVKEMLIKRMNDGAEFVKRTGIKWALMVP